MNDNSGNSGNLLNLLNEISSENTNINNDLPMQNIFINNIINLLVNSNSNPTNYTNFNSNFNNVLNQSFQEKNKYKKIISKKGLTSLKKIKFNKNMNQKECPIFMTKFEENEEVTQLPCKHIFNNIAIEKWLKEENHICPVCRYELDFKEVKNTIDIEENNNEDDNDTEDNNNTEIENELENNSIYLNPLENNYINPISLLQQTYSNRLYNFSNINSNFNNNFNNLLNMESNIDLDRHIQEILFENYNNTNNTE
jgi:hypothetical protein